MKRYFKIAKICFFIEADNVEVHKELDDFEINKPDDVDFEIILSKEDFGYSGTQLVGFPNSCVSDEGDNFIISYHNTDFVYGSRISKRDKKATIYVDKYGMALRDTKNVELEKDPLHKQTAGELLLYSIRDVFLYFAQEMGYIAVHAASIIYKDEVYGFSAESGGGKSTHVENWITSGFDSKIYNGDLLLLKAEKEGVMTYGMPWCGTSKIYSKENYPLKGIMFINKDEKNYAKQISKVDSVINLNARCFSPNWTKEKVEMNIDSAVEITTKIKFCELYCTKDASSAEFSKEYIDGGNLE